MFKIMCILSNTGEVVDVESEQEPKLNESFMYKGKFFRISECHQSVVPELCDFVVQLAK